MDNTQRVYGSVQPVGPQVVSPLVAIEATLTTLLATVSTEVTLENVLTALGLVAKDSTVAKDASLATIISDLGLLATEANLTAVKTLVTSLLAVVNQAQGASGLGVTGPMVQALVSDMRPAVTDGTLAPLSMNAEGRLRVTTELAEVEFFGAGFYPRCLPNFSASPW